MFAYSSTGSEREQHTRARLQGTDREYRNISLCHATTRATVVAALVGADFTSRHTPHSAEQRKDEQLCFPANDPPG